MPTQDAELSSEMCQNPTFLCSVSYRLVGSIPEMLEKLIDLSARHPMTVISLLAVLVRVALDAFFCGLFSGDTVIVEYLSVISRTLASDDDKMVDVPPVSLSSLALAMFANSVLNASWISSLEI